MARTCCVAGTVSPESWLNEVRWNSTGRVASEVSRCFRYVFHHLLPSFADVVWGCKLSACGDYDRIQISSSSLVFIFSIWLDQSQYLHFFRRWNANTLLTFGAKIVWSMVESCCIVVVFPTCSCVLRGTGANFATTYLCIYTPPLFHVAMLHGSDGPRVEATQQNIQGQWMADYHILVLRYCKLW